MTNWEFFLKTKKVKSKRERELVRSAWINGLAEAKKLVKISARADAIEAGMPVDGEYHNTYAHGLEKDIEQYIKLLEKRK